MNSFKCPFYILFQSVPFVSVWVKEEKDEEGEEEYAENEEECAENEEEYAENEEYTDVVYYLSLIHI